MQSVVSHFGDWLHMDDPNDWGGDPWDDAFPTHLEDTEEGTESLQIVPR